VEKMDFTRSVRFAAENSTGKADWRVSLYAKVDKQKGTAQKDIGNT
jgi:hypothetical protein